MNLDELLSEADRRIEGNRIDELFDLCTGGLFGDPDIEVWAAEQDWQPRQIGEPTHSAAHVPLIVAWKRSAAVYRCRARAMPLPNATRTC